jgi:hypothetical protein
MKSALASRLAIPSALALLMLLQLLCAPGHYLGFEQDGAFYALASRSLLAGRYTLGISPGEPLLTFLTPGWPLLLTPAAAISGDAPAGYQLWAWAWLAACVPLTFYWLRSRIGEGAALAGVAAFALNPFILSRSGVVASEAPALAGTLGLLLLLERKKRLPGWAAGLWLAGLWLIRPAAIVVWPAVALWYAYHARRQLGGLIAAACAPVFAWMAWTKWVGGGVAEFQELAQTLPGQGLGGFVSTAAHNAQNIAGLWGQSSLPVPLPAEHHLALIVGTALLVAAGAGAAAALGRSKKDFDPAALILASGLALHLIWAWWFERYLLPFLPFLLWGLWRWVERQKKGAGVWVLALLALLPLVGQSRHLLSDRQSRYVPEHHAAYKWIQQNTPAHTLLSSAFYARDAFYTGRPFVPLPTGGNAPLTSRLKAGRIALILWHPMPDLGSAQGARFVWNRRLRVFAGQLAKADLLVAFHDEKTMILAPRRSH